MRTFLKKKIASTETKTNQLSPLFANSTFKMSQHKKFCALLTTIIASVVLGLFIRSVQQGPLTTNNSTLQITIAPESENPASLLVEVYGLVLAIMLAVAFQSRKTIGERRLGEAFSALLIASCAMTAIFTGCLLPELFTQNNATMAGILFISGTLLLSWILTYGLAQHISYQAMRVNEEYRDQCVQMYIDFRSEHANSCFKKPVVARFINIVISFVLDFLSLSVAASFAVDILHAPPSFYAICASFAALNAIVFSLNPPFATFKWVSSHKSSRGELLVDVIVLLTAFIITTAISGLFLGMIYTDGTHKIKSFMFASSICFGLNLATQIITNILARFILIPQKEKKLKEAAANAQRNVEEQHFNNFTKLAASQFSLDSDVEHFQNLLYRCKIKNSQFPDWATTCYPIASDSNATALAASDLPLVSYSSAELHHLLKHDSPRHKQGATARINDCLLLRSLIYTNQDADEAQNRMIKMYLSLMFNDSEYLTVSIPENTRRGLLLP